MMLITCVTGVILTAVNFINDRSLIYVGIPMNIYTFKKYNINLTTRSENGILKMNEYLEIILPYHLFNVLLHAFLIQQFLGEFLHVAYE